jgi:hypothetical protein
MPLTLALSPREREQEKSVARLPTLREASYALWERGRG